MAANDSRLLDLGVSRAGRHQVMLWIRRSLSPTLLWWFAQLHRRAVVLFSELSLAVISYTLSVTILQEEKDPRWAFGILVKTVVWVVAFRFLGLLALGLYRRSLRHASIPDLISICETVSLSSVLCVLAIRISFPTLHLPLSLFVIDWALLQFFWGTLHLGARVYKTVRVVGRCNHKRVVIVGAGDAGLNVLKELTVDPGSHCRPVAIVDDDPSKCGTTVYGVSVLGSTRDLVQVVRATQAEEVLICIPSATRSQMSRILLASRECGVPMRTLPSLSDLLSGQASQQDLHRIRIEDILQRNEVQNDPTEIRDIVSDRTVLVTGAGGSIGSELCRQIAAAGPRSLLLLDKSENSLFYIHRELREHFATINLKPLLIDIVRDGVIHDVLQSERPETIFHAAAHKHVGLLELHPHEAIRNNVLGTRNLSLAALECGAERLVNISTDKAVNPFSYMGLSKKLTEFCIQELSRRHSTRFMNVRFGNVAGSAGSVLRLFKDQIQKGEPLRVTDPRATRYFMSIPEAVYLILRAAIQGEGGETFVFQMGEAINIYELAKTLVLFAGLLPEKDLPIHFVGLSEGEKMEEELWEEWEHAVPTMRKEILVIKDQNPLSFGILDRIQKLEEFLNRGDCIGLISYLNDLMPGFAARRHPALQESADILTPALEAA